MTKEQCRKALKDMNCFAHIYEWVDEPNAKYPPHTHKGRVTLYVIKGSIAVNYDSKSRVLDPTNNSFDVPVGVVHTAQVGQEGCTLIVGEEINGDS